MKCKVKVGFVFHSKDEKGLPVVYLPGEFVEIDGVRIPAQLEAVKEEKKPVFKGKPE